MRNIFLSFFIFVFTFTKSFSYDADPKLFVTALVNDAIGTLSNNDLTDEEKKLKIEQIALEHVDVNGLGLYTLGPIRKELDETVLKNYNQLFEKYLLKSLTDRLSQYSKQKFEVLSAEQKSSNYTIVNSKLLAGEDKPELKVNWRVYTKDKTKPLIRDLTVEGLSLARTQKEEFASILNSNNNDINALLLRLEEFIKE